MVNLFKLRSVMGISCNHYNVTKVTYSHCLCTIILLIKYCNNLLFQMKIEINVN